MWRKSVVNSGLTKRVERRLGAHEPKNDFLLACFLSLSEESRVPVRRKVTLQLWSLASFFLHRSYHLFNQLCFFDDISQAVTAFRQPILHTTRNDIFPQHRSVSHTKQDGYTKSKMIGALGTTASSSSSSSRVWRGLTCTAMRGLTLRTSTVNAPTRSIPSLSNRIFQEERSPARHLFAYQSHRLPHALFFFYYFAT